MGIRLKTFIVISAGALAVALVMLGAIRIFLIDNLLNQEDQILKQNYKSISIMLNSRKDSLRSTLLDWAKWDDTFNFIKDSNQAYIKDNLQNSTFTDLSLNMMIFLNNKGKIIYAKGYDLENGVKTPIDTGVISYINKHQQQLLNIRGNDILAGMLMVSNRPMIILITSITQSDEKPPAEGYLVIGQYLDKSYLNYLDEVTHETIEIGSVNQIQARSLDDDLVIEKSKTLAMATAFVKDLNGNPDIAITMKRQRNIYDQGIKTLHLFRWVFLAGLFTIIVICILAIDRTILKRLHKLYSFVHEVSIRKDVWSRIELSGKDEISRLATAINQMLEEIKTAYKDIQEGEERFRLTMEATNDGFWDLRIEDMNLYINSEWLRLVGDETLNKEDLYKKYFCPAQEDGSTINNALDECIRGDKEYLHEEYSVCKITGEQIWILNRGKVVDYDSSGQPKRVVGTFSDITTQKRIEQELYSLSYTDKLTGLKNRAYMEKVLESLDQSAESNYQILMGDLNGLKYTNDTYGHNQGDKLLCQISEIFKKSCSVSDIIARWGGDEFIILIKDKDQLYCQEVIKKIKSECKNISPDLPIKLSIAIGSAEKTGNYKSKDIIKIAEERMYQNKLLESTSLRSSTLLSLERTLFEKDQETEEHAARLRTMCVKIGEAMRFSQYELDELALFAMLHDIGKIAIPDHILMKPDKLSEEEWGIMKKHSEIGFRIAESTPELSHIAKNILSHHERYDGKGYPNGLKGEGIPKMARILSIVDSFDVMTNTRPYKAAISVEEAIEELKACAGKQFDPAIVEVFLKLLKDNKLEKNDIISS
ncbi:HD domain-containing phosphohydrolase [Desulfosporosinus sp. FKB]|uniref:HD domain-containing phosphohydrolase n=1 Tax=Desulfosporosinus sp. FKB TaxID=1969835 RepID=UPI000B49ACD4|nr:HD domain-containing phosphohydrolase [Desulfosporosinus sp. FKB]